MAGIILYGGICQLVGIFLTTDKANFSIGLWVGVLTALFMAYHMARVIDNAMELGENGAQKTVVAQNVIRYVVVVIILAILMMTNIGNPIAAFIGTMGLKVSAYMQPLLAKCFTKNQETIE
ncbi:MAG: ATP synthase subunit I [Lachnospiraceae bacterium]|nr:ATP synthase subunit I [Lachnospiraceae bacterium]